MCRGSRARRYWQTPLSDKAWLDTVGSRIAAGYTTMPLPILVEAALAELTSAGKLFTAYDVTLLLRALFPYPRRLLPHYDQHGAPGVHAEVHRQMAGYLAAGSYSVEEVYVTGAEPADLYVPCNRRRNGRGPLTLIRGSAPLPPRVWVVRHTSW